MQQPIIRNASPLREYGDVVTSLEAEAGSGVELEDVCASQFFVPCWEQLAALKWPEIFVYQVSGDWTARLRVLSASEDGVRTRLIEHHICREDIRA